MTGLERRGRRTPTTETGTIKIGFFRKVTCELRDVSPGGARIVAPEDVDLPEEFSIRTPQFRRARPCIRRWQCGRETGVEFI